jgi:adenylate kinase family enzyme/YHS domain-containing protein
VVPLRERFQAELTGLLEAREASIKAQVEKEENEGEILDGDGQRKVPEPPPEDEEPRWKQPVPPEEEIKMAVEALQKVLSGDMRACVLDAGGWFPEVQSEDGPVDLAGLLTRARRIPDLVVVLSMNETQARERVCNAKDLDDEQEKRNAEYEAAVQKREEYIEANPDLEEPPPEIPTWDPEQDPDAQKIVYGSVKRVDVTGLDPDGRQAALDAETTAQQGKLAAFSDALVELRASLATVDAGVKWQTQAACINAVARSVHLKAKAYVEDRAHLLARAQTEKVSFDISETRRVTGRARYSVLGRADAADPELPISGERFAAQFRDRLYYFKDAAARDAFLEKPLVPKVRPSNCALIPAVVVLGPPLAGKSTQARLLAQKLNAVRVTIPGVLEQATSIDTPRSGVLAAALLKGTVPDELLVEAVVTRLTQHDCLTQGWVLDGFPQTLDQAKLLATYGFRPQVVCVLSLPKLNSLERARAISDGTEATGRPGGRQTSRAANSLKGSPALVEMRCKDSGDISLLYAFYASTYDCVYRFDATRSIWALSSATVKIVEDCFRTRNMLMRTAPRKARSQPLGLPMSDPRASPYGRFCPVAATSEGRTVVAKDASLCALYDDKVYWLSSAAALKAFLAEPEAYLSAPSDFPRLATFAERKDPRLEVALDGHCPVSLKSGELKRTRAHLIVYKDDVYAAAGEAEAIALLETPEKYVHATLPAKVPPPVTSVSLVYDSMEKARSGESGEELTDHLTYLQVAVSEPISRALVAAGEARHLYPGLGSKSTLLHMAKHLRAHNNLNTKSRQSRAEEELALFLQNCAVPEDLKAYITRRQEVRAAGAWTNLDETRYQELALLFDAHFSPAKGAPHPVRRVLGKQ